MKAILRVEYNTFVDDESKPAGDVPALGTIPDAKVIEDELNEPEWKRIIPLNPAISDQTCISGDYGDGLLGLGADCSPGWERDSEGRAKKIPGKCVLA